ncbi:rho guanine nucleotide exchange factor 7b isoform X1 [Myxocyprinus asiaticus]|uniref:rho guanine nucleotide exchange factor 7b isoform X1 n=1 Tax=Myxocyprinus asiaticus TaxID=70543 RepID=UPI002221F470|nr:rho guanine nucleotide exchange factor 7b isoform X1 [Myxocyprinus asiaticus]
MNSAEQTITWLITLGVLESPKKTLSDPEGFLQASLRDGVVLCKLLERLRPGSVHTIYQDPRKESEYLSNIREFLKGCALHHIEVFEANELLQGQNFTKVLNCLVALNKATSDCGGGSDSMCLHNSSSLRIKSFDSINCPSTHSRSSRHKYNQYRSLDMSESSGLQVLVKAKFNFQQTNEDELSFSKGDIIQVTRQEDGGWWEGTLNGKSGWFPSNYVKEIKGYDKPVSPKSASLKSLPKGFETANFCKTYYNVVVQNIVQTETEYCKELQTLLSTYLRVLQPTDRLSVSDISHIMGNLEEISSFQQTLVHSLEESVKVPESQQRIGGFFLSLVPQLRGLYVTYCSNHPSAVNVLTQHSEELGEFMESKGASSPGILTLTTGLSKPFLRLEKYPTLLKEMERHMEEIHLDRPDIQKSMTAFKNLSAHCQEVRKRKELELQILTESIRGWEGEGIRALGSVLYMSQVLIQNHGTEEKNERYLLLFPHVLLILSTSPRMSGFIFQGKLLLTGMAVNKIEDNDSTKNAFEISGNMIERIQVICYNQRDLQEWMDNLNRQTKRTSTSNMKPQNTPCHTLPSHPLTPSRHSENRVLSGSPVYHTLPHLSSYGTPHSGMMWGPLEPPKTQKPWSLSCLRPAPPLKPSAALCYKEDLSKSPKSMKKLLPKRKPERKPSDEEFAVRKSTAALEEDAQILKVIEAYCTSAKTRQTLNSRSRKESGPHMLFPEEEKIIVEETKSNGQTVIEERSLVDTVYALRDEVQELKQDNKRMKRTLEEEQKARKELEKIVRKVLKSMNDPSWDETNL